MVYNKCNKKIYILLPNLEGGGAEKLSVNLANYWESLGYNIKILLLENKGVLKEQLSQNIKIVDLKSKKIRNLFFQLPKFLKFDTPDILLVSMWPLTSIAPLSIFIFRLKVKVFISEHVNLTESLKNELLINDFFAKIIIKMTFRFTNGIIAVSKGVKQNILKYYDIKNNKKIRTIYNPIITEKMLSNKNNNYDYKNIWGEKSLNRILTVGTLKEQKNHKDLIKAFSKIPLNESYKLIILGDGPLKNKLKKYIKELDQDKRIEIHPFTLNPEEYYKTATLFILNSKWEGFGNVLVEALFYKLPIISTNCLYGPNEILKKGKYGKLIELNDIDKLKDAILNYNYDKDDKEERFNRSLDYSVQIISKEYISFFFNN